MGCIAAERIEGVGVRLAIAPCPVRVPAYLPLLRNVMRKVIAALERVGSPQREVHCHRDLGEVRRLRESMRRTERSVERAMFSRA